VKNTIRRALVCLTENKC